MGFATDSFLVPEMFKNIDRYFFHTLFNQVQDGIAGIDPSRRVVFWNQAAERFSGYGREDVLGKSCADDLAMFLDLDGTSVCRDKCPVVQTLRDRAIRTVECDLRHKDGYIVPVEIRVVPLFSDQGELSGALEILSGTAPRLTIPLPTGELERIDLLDRDTGISGRKYLDMQLRIRLEEYQKFGVPFGVLYFDVDNYGRLLDKFGRFNAGKALRLVARTLHKNVRYFDIVGRWNTEEFLVILLNVDENRLGIVANKLRLMVQESYVMIETGALNTTVSVGAALAQRYDTVESLVKRAEQLMLHSKWRGRNTVSVNFTQKE